MQNTLYEILETLETDSEKKLIDHVFIFHSLIFAYVVSTVLKTLNESIFTDKLNSISWFIFFWNIFLLLFLLESWWGLWKDRFHTKIKFESFLLPLIHPIIILVMYYILNSSYKCSFLSHSPLFVFSPIFYVLFALDVVYIIFLKKVCYTYYNLKKKSIRDRLGYSFLILLWFILNYCFSENFFSPNRNFYSKTAIEFWYLVSTFMGLILAFSQLALFVIKHRRYEYNLLTQKVKFSLIKNVSNYIYLILKSFKSKDISEMEDGFGLMRIKIENYCSSVKSQMKKELRSFDDFTVLMHKEFESYSMYLFFPFLKKENDLDIITNRLSGFLEYELAGKTYIKFHTIKSDLKSKNEHITSHNIVEYVKNITDYKLAI